MKFLITVLFIAYTSTFFAQKSFTETEAREVVDIFFDGFHKGDTLIMNTVLSPNAILQSASKNKQGVDVLEDTNFGPACPGTTGRNFKKSIAARPSNQVWKEVILDYSVAIDGNLAHVWTPYEFYFNETFSHCGANAFTLAKLPEGWKIIHLIDSRRREGCKALKKK